MPKWEYAAIGIEKKKTLCFSTENNSTNKFESISKSITDEWLEA